MNFMSNSKEKHFHTIYAATNKALYGAFIKITKDEDLTLEILQKAYLKLWENWDNVDDKDNCYPLLYTYSKNTFIDILRKKNREKDVLNEIKAKNFNAHENIEDVFQYKEYQDALKKIVDAMPTKRQHVYRLAKEEGLSYKNISEQLLISTNTIENHMQSAYKTIKKELKLQFNI